MTVAAVNTSMTVCTMVCGLPPVAATSTATVKLSSTRTAPVGESMPVAIGGNDVASAIQTPEMQLPISIAQIAIGTPAPSSPGNISAPNETMLPIRTTEASRPAIVSPRMSRTHPRRRDADCAPASLRAIASDGPACTPFPTCTSTSLDVRLRLDVFIGEEPRLEPSGVPLRNRKSLEVRIALTLATVPAANVSEPALHPAGQVRLARRYARRCEPAHTCRPNG